MSLSTHEFRDEFKTHLEKWEGLSHSKLDENLLFEIEKWGAHIEKFIQEKVRLLEMDFNEYPLQGEYLRSISEGFDDLAQIMKTHKTLMDVSKNHDFPELLHKIKYFYTHYLVPLLNILSKLENDYVAIVTKTIVNKGKMIADSDNDLKKLINEKERVSKNFLSFNRREKLIAISKKIKIQELNKKIMRLTLHHDRLNLYYFNHDRPPELKEIKEKADNLRTELKKMEEINYE